MIVFDASAVVSAALKADSRPAEALLLAEASDIFALSAAVDFEIESVLSRPKFSHVIRSETIARVLGTLRSGAIWFEPAVRVSDCRDPKDNKYLELALASGAAVIVSGDEDLLVLNPWRGVLILRPAAYLDLETAPG